jgi:hypothetical protein
LPVGAVELVQIAGDALLDLELKGGGALREWAHPLPSGADLSDAVGYFPEEPKLTHPRFIWITIAIGLIE